MFNKCLCLSLILFADIISALIDAQQLTGGETNESYQEYYPIYL